MKAKEVRIVLGEEVTSDVFRRRAEELGWLLLQEHQPTADTTFELVYAATKDQKTTVHFVEDEFVKVRYVVVRGPQTDKNVRLVESRFDCYDDEDILKKAERDGSLQEMIDWMMSATVLGDQAGRERLVTLIKRRLHHENSGVARAALIAVSWLEWAEFRKDVEALAENSSPDVRADATRLKEAYQLRDSHRL